MLTILDRDKPIKDLPKKFKDILNNYISEYAEARECKFDDILIDGELYEVQRDLPLRMKKALEELRN